MKDNTHVNDQPSFRADKGFLDGIYDLANMHIQLFGPDGQLKQEEFVHNTVTSAGKAGLINQVTASPSLAKPGWIAIGTGSPASTLLGTEIARVAMSSNTTSSNVATFVATFGAGTGTGAITEAGVFDVVTANTVNMWCSSSFATVNKGSLDSLTITWTLTVS